MVFFRHTEVLNLAFHKVPFLNPFYSCFSSMICTALPRFSISYFFADNTNFFLSHKSYETLFRLMNSELILVNNCLMNNRLSLNVSKTNSILFRSRRKHLPSNEGVLTINNISIPRVDNARFLGVHIDQFLTWKTHISNVSSKVAKTTLVFCLGLVTYFLFIFVLASIILWFILICHIVALYGPPIILRA